MTLLNVYTQRGELRHKASEELPSRTLCGRDVARRIEASAVSRLIGCKVCERTAAKVEA